MDIFRRRHHDRKEDQLDRIEHKVDQILKDEQKEEKFLRSAKLDFQDSFGIGEETMTPLIVHINDAPKTAVFTEFDGPGGTGNKVPPVGVVTFASDNPGVCTVDPTSGVLAYIADGTANISGTDAGNSISATNSVTISAAVAQSATVDFV